MAPMAITQEQLDQDRADKIRRLSDAVYLALVSGASREDVDAAIAAGAAEAERALEIRRRSTRRAA